MLTPERMAQIAKACWPDNTDVWTPRMIETLLSSDTGLAVCRDDGFALLRIAGDEAELLSLDVLPRARRKGLGTEILSEALRRSAARGARQVFLEVDKANVAAIALYSRAGFETIGERKKYYRNPDGSWADARVMARYFSKPDADRAQSGKRDGN